MLIWSSSSALLDIKMCFLRRWQKIGGLPSPPHTHTTWLWKSRDFPQFAGKGGWTAGWNVTLRLEGLVFQEAKGGARFAEESLHCEVVWGGCCVSARWRILQYLALFVNSGCFNHEKSDKQGIGWRRTFFSVRLPVTPQTGRGPLRSSNSVPPWQNCVIPFAPLLPHSANFKTTKRKPENGKTFHSCLLSRWANTAGRVGH